MWLGRGAAGRIWGEEGVRQHPASRVASGAQPSVGSGSTGTPKSRPGMMQAQGARATAGSRAAGGAGRARGPIPVWGWSKQSLVAAGAAMPSIQICSLPSAAQHCGVSSASQPLRAHGESLYPSGAHPDLPDFRSAEEDADGSS